MSDVRLYGWHDADTCIRLWTFPSVLSHHWQRTPGPGVKILGAVASPPGDELAHSLEREGLKRFAQRLIAHEGRRINQYGGGVVLLTTKIREKKSCFLIELSLPIPWLPPWTCQKILITVLTLWYLCLYIIV